MDAANQSVAPAALAQFTKVPIAQLSPTLEQTQEKCIDATVTLVWPYSSSTKSLSLLLAEPDFRLRRSHGQVKATFYGQTAERVATSHVGIGDNVRLALKGSKFVANDTASQTPGRYVAWDLQFVSELSLEVNRSSKDSAIIILDHFDSVSCEPTQLQPSTPRAVSTAPEGAEEALWESPAFLRSSSTRLSSVFRVPVDEAGDEDGSVPGKGRKRPRYSLNRNDWHLVEDPMSPQEKGPVSDWWEKESWEKTSEDNLDAELELGGFEEPELQNNVPIVEVEAGAQDSSTLVSREISPVFVKPPLERPGAVPDGQHLQANDTSAAPVSASAFKNPLLSDSQLPTDTPKLRPIPSPGLPVPSPIVSHPSENGGYFSEARTFYPPTHSASSEANAITTVSEPISFSNISPVSSPIAPELTSGNLRDAIETSQSSFTPTGLVIDHPTLPSTLGDQDMLLDERENPASSEDIDDVEVPESAILQSHIGQGFPPAETDQVVADSVRLETLQELSNRVDYDVDSNEYSEPDSSSETGTGVSRPRDPFYAEDNSELGHPVYALPRSGHLSSSDDEHSVAAQHLLLRRRSFSDSETNAAEDDISEEEIEEQVASDYPDEYDEGLSDEDTDESDAEDLPRQSGPPEVIVLDSDSEDELTSDHPVVPQSTYRDDSSRHISSPQSESEEFDTSEQDEGSGSEAEEFEPDDVEAEVNIPTQEDRVHDSDKEEESSVDVLARDHYSALSSNGESSVYEDDANDTAEGPRREAEETTYRDDHPDESFKIYSNSDSPIYLDESDGNDQSDAGESTFPREDSAPASRIEKAWTGKQPKGFDGADDREFESTGFSAEPNDQADKHTEAALDKSADQQLLTPDPTQEMATGPQTSATKEAKQFSDQDTQKLSTGLNLSFPPTSGVSSLAPGLPVDHDISSPHLEQEPTPDAATEVDTNKDSPGVPLIIVPTTEAVPQQEQPEDTRDENPNANDAVAIQLPVPDRHAHGLRSKLSYFAPLATLADHFGALVDTISIVHETSPIVKATSGSKEYFMTVHITDPSMAGTTLKAQIFRRYKSAMPTLAEGNAVLLRDFKVQSHNHSIMLLSVQSSSWAVFDGSGPDAQVNGPPVEYRSEERAFASGLRNWYAEIGAHMVADHHLQSSVHRDDMDREGSALISESGSIDSVSRDPTSSARSSRRRKSHRRVTIHELRDGRRYAEVGSPSTKESIHELRDGTVYANL